MNTQEKIKFYADVYDAALECTKNVDASIAILEQIGLDSRTQFISDDRKNGFKPQSNIPKTNVEFATPKQMIALKKHNLWKDGLTKSEATQIIKESIERNY